MGGLEISDTFKRLNVQIIKKSDIQKESETPQQAPENKENGQRKKDRNSRPKNTENFEPLNRPVDMRIVFDLHPEKLQTKLTSRDVLMVPNLFSDFQPGEVYQKLVQEIEDCGVPQSRLLKLWHGDSHLIADDHTNWKEKAPTFKVLYRYYV